MGMPDDDIVLVTVILRVRLLALLVMHPAQLLLLISCCYGDHDPLSTCHVLRLAQ
jgi:hypothetical protein